MSMSEFDTLMDDTESSLADTDVLPWTEGRGTSSPGLRYGTFSLASYVPLEWLLRSVLSNVRSRWAN
jgi:hypothetical protein